MTLLTVVIINMTRMQAWKESQDEDLGVTDEELEIERERATDPFRPLAIVLLDIAREKLAREKEGRKTEDQKPAQRSRHARP